MNWDHDDRFREAQHVAEDLDRGCVDEAGNRLRNDLYQMQYDPCDQREFLNMVNAMDRKGYGADLQIQIMPDGRETWNIIPPGGAYYGGGYQRPYDNGYPCPDRQYQVQYPYQQAPYEPPVQYTYQQPTPGEAIVDGLAAGAGVAIGAALMGRAFGYGNRNYYDHDRDYGRRDYRGHRR